MSRNTTILQRLDSAGKHAEDAVLVLILGSMILLATGQIIGRNLFDTAFFAGDELLRLMVLWLTLAGAVGPRSYRQGRPTRKTGQ